MTCGRGVTGPRGGILARNPQRIGFPMLRVLTLATVLTLVAPSVLNATGKQTAVVNSSGFMSAHPDIRWRTRGLQAQGDGDHGQALEYYLRAARFADKASAAAIGEMYWMGQGVRRDRSLAYAWMDLAAERHWRLFLVRREGMWSELSDAERQLAIELGRRIYEEYGDAVAKPRLERTLARERRRSTGSRTGSTGALSIQIPTPSGMVTLDGSQYYAEKYWEPRQYWRWQQEIWAPELTGQVDVGPIAQATPEADPDETP
jgi:uncharacterized protein